jgi:hypothetical protein
MASTDPIELMVEEDGESDYPNEPMHDEDGTMRMMPGWTMEMRYGKHCPLPLTSTRVLLQR